MTSDSYERLRERLEEQLRADIELLQEAHRAKLRALETVARARGELEGRPGAAAADPSAAPATVREAAPVAPAPRAAPPAPPARKNRGAYEIHEAVEAALAKVGETFDRNDLCAALGFVPSRSTLYRVLGDLMQERKIDLVGAASGNQPTRYRKLATPPPSGGARPQGSDAQTRD